ncbi:MAG TPA: PilN domain-containing protein [Patescibacteria group bacterium]
MAARNTKEPRINLLPQEEFESSTLGRIFRWLISSFRLIVIATEMVVMGAFLSRFWLDSKVSDLTEAINQKKAVITSYAQVEKNFREAQKELAIFSSVAYDKSKYIPLLQTLTTALPDTVQITFLSVDASAVEIRATSTSEVGAGTFIANLKAIPNMFDKVSLTQTTIDQTTGNITFQVLATQKGVAATPKPNGT